MSMAGEPVTPQEATYVNYRTPVLVFILVKKVLVFSI
uniref:Uncharacterized protein n=1 Tax=Arundo donax TaxID=35708 RepID=A0A0A9C3U8_ARUDO